MMGGIDDDVLIIYLQQVVRGNMAMNQFYLECKRYKSVVQTRQLIMAHVLQMDDGNDGQLTWGTVSERYPYINNNLVDAWQPTIQSQKIKDVRQLPAKLKAILNKTIREVREHSAAVKVLFLLIHAFCLQ